jgi:hypothetical protein
MTTLASRTSFSFTSIEISDKISMNVLKPIVSFKSGTFMIWIKMFSGLLLIRKQELCDLYKTIFLALEMINKNDVIVVAMATMTFQYGSTEYF